MTGTEKAAPTPAFPSYVKAGMVPSTEARGMRGNVTPDRDTLPVPAPYVPSLDMVPDAVTV